MTEPARLHPIPRPAPDTDGVMLTRAVMLAALLHEGVTRKGLQPPFIASVTDYFGLSLQFEDEATFYSWARWLGAAGDVSEGYVVEGRMHYASTCEYAGEHVALAWVSPRK